MKINLFIKREYNNNEFSYNINPFLEDNDDNKEYFNFIGKLIAKAIINNYALNVCFNKIIYKIILDEKIEFKDLFKIDRTLYNSLNNLKNLLNQSKNMEVSDLEIYYNIEIKDINNYLHKFELQKNCYEKKVNNKEELNIYIQKRIDFMIGQIYIFVNEIKKSLFNIIPINFFNNFNSNELELIVNGEPIIDKEDWKNNTDYDGYNKNDETINWFWNIINELNQKQLNNLLIYTTGSARVPVRGFCKLTSNKGILHPFTISKIGYDSKKINYIKAHTCFNKIEIPDFPNKDKLKEAMLFICDVVISGFGNE